MKQFLRIIALAVAGFFMFCTAPVIAEEPETVLFCREEVILPDGDFPSANAADGYIRNAMKSAGESTSASKLRFAASGARLPGAAGRLYNALRPQIAKAAAGQTASTIFRIPLSDLAENLSCSAKDLGYTSFDEPGAIEAFFTKAGLPTGEERIKVLNALLADLPYDLYWFDKTRGMKYSGAPYTVSKNGVISFSHYDEATVDVYFSVADDYTGGGEFQLNTKFGQAVQNAAKNAKEIVSSNRDRSDYQKLIAYRDWICDHVSYNHGALNPGTAYGNPWQLVWVFDGDSSTNVVCEGYAKAFQYLCDATAFQGSVSSIIVEGEMYTETENGGRHMWNVVTLNDGKRYLADLTSYDSGKDVFLAGYNQTSTWSDGRTAYLYSGLWYLYDGRLTDLYTAEELTVSSGESASEEPDPEESAWNEPEYRWEEDGSTVTAILQSKTDPHATVLETAVTTMTEEPSGQTIYTAEFTNEAFSTQTREIRTEKDHADKARANKTPADETSVTDAQPAEQKTKIEFENGKYKLDGKKAIFTGPADKGLTTLTIPDSVSANGMTYKVTEIKAKACKGMAKLKEVTIGKNVKVIGKEAFNGCKKLKTIRLRTDKLKSKNVGRNAFKNINKKAVFRCPKEVRDAYKAWIPDKGAPEKCKYKND